MRSWWIVSRACFALAKAFARCGNKIAGWGCYAESYAVDAASKHGKLFYYENQSRLGR